MSVIFTYGANEVTLRNPELGNREPVEIIQARGRTADGELVVTDKGIRVNRFYLEWRELTTQNKTDLLDFFGVSKVNGSANVFTYTDHDAQEYSVRLLSDVLEPVEYWNGRWSLDLVLEEASES